jgi:hypothetical protein
MRRIPLFGPLAVLAALFLAAPASSRPPIRSSFFALYPQAVGTVLDDVPSNASHCGVCHLDFDGGGPRNPYGLAIQVGLNNGLTKEQAILAVEGSDSDGDGFTSLTEVTDLADFSNTPTFPGLTTGNAGTTLHVTLADITPYLTPSGGSDTTPPSVTVLSPAGGENVFAVGFWSVTYTATDASGVSHVNVYLSDDGGATFDPVGRLAAPSGTFQWFVPNLPGAANRIRVEAFDTVGNSAFDDSDLDFTITSLVAGTAPTTIRDMKLPGTQPFEGAVLDNPADCAGCHGGYNAAVEPWYNWRGSAMAQAMRDPLFLACLAVAEQDAPSVGDLCLRCHTPGGWQEGRSVDTSGGLLNAKDREGIQCDFCHRIVDRDYVPGVSPPQDEAVLATVDPLPLQYGNGQFINDPAPVRRGPFADAQASHAFLASPIHRSSDLCGTCHDVSNPVFVRTGPLDYALDPLDTEHVDFDVRNMFPIERTFSEWSASTYAAGGVYAPQFAGTKPDGIVSTCGDCHLRDVQGKGCGEPGSPVRTDLPLHDLTGGNVFLADVLPAMWPGEVDAAQLQAAKQRAVSMLQLAATLTAEPQDYGLSVRVTNEGAHKLPSGYPEGRRVWLHVVALDATGGPVFESGRWDPATGELASDPQLKVWETHPGLSPGLAAALGLPPGPSFHFVLNDTVYFDNRIPPRGFTNAAFLDVQSPPVGVAYADGQFWDDTSFFLPASAETARVTLLYQTTTKEYVEFLRDANVTNGAGQQLYDAWAASGRCPPVTMAQITVPLGTISTDAPTPLPAIALHVGKPRPNPFAGTTSIELALGARSRVTARVFDASGRLVRTLVDGTLEPSRRELIWNGRDDAERSVASGIYFVDVRVDARTFHRKVVLLR